MNPTEYSDQKILRVALADKLDNVRSMVADYRYYRQKGQAEAFWKRFNASKADQLWFIGELVEILKEMKAKERSRDALIPPYFLEEFERAVQELGQRT